MSLEVTHALAPKSLDWVVKNLSDPAMVLTLDQRVEALQAQVDEICKRRGWSLDWLKHLDEEAMDPEARLVRTAIELIDYLEYLRRGSI